MSTIMPCFDQYPNEAALIGKILAGYGEIEFGIASCLLATMDRNADILKALFRLRNERQRIDMADALLRQPLEKERLGGQYGVAIGAVKWCRSIRNQYAHGHWAHIEQKGLGFCDLQKEAQTAGTPKMKFKYVNEPLLQEQENYFRYTQDCLLFLTAEMDVRKGRKQAHPFSMPIQIPQPPKHLPL